MFCHVDFVLPQIAKVWVDGACSNNGKPNAKAGYGCYWGPKHALNISAPVTGLVQTNNRAELTAAIVAIGQAISHGTTELEIITDSKYVVGCATIWVVAWKRKNWQGVKNDDLVMGLYNLCSMIKVKWTHVKGHVGDEGNEAADKLAVEGAKMYD